MPVMPAKLISYLIAVLLLLAPPVAMAAKPAPEAQRPMDMPSYEISVTLNPSEGSVAGGVRIHLPATGDKGARRIIQTGGVEVKSASLDGRDLSLKVEDGLMEVRGDGVLEMLFEARFADSAPEQVQDNVGVVSGNAITGQYAFLMSGWYPRLAGAGIYSLTVVAPEGMVPVSEADEIVRTSMDGGTATKNTFRLNSPSEGITLVAADYVLLKASGGPVGIEAYFYERDRDLGQRYMEVASEFIQMYEAALGPFPYKRFAVVESPQPTGYAMPTYTLIGERVAKLPFIIKTSLGHEIVHQWFGNSVRVAGGGNWSEGLASYLSGHLYDQVKGEGPAHRKRLLLDYHNYVRPGSELGLREFRSRTDLSTRAVGYAKGAMVFHMLARKNQEAFIEGLRDFYESYKFRAAGWKDLRAVFEQAMDEDLGWFFQQWVDRKGLADFRLTDARAMVMGGKDVVHFKLVQQGGPMKFLLPVKVFFKDGSYESHAVRVGSVRQQAFDITVSARPVSIALDSGYDLMRKLDPREIPPTVSALTGAAGIVVLPGGDNAAYEAVAGDFKARGYSIVNEPDLSYSDLSGKPAIVAADCTGTLKWLFGSPPVSPAVSDSGDVKGVSLEVMKNPMAPALPLAVLWSSSSEEAEAASSKISHYGRYSRLAFSAGRNTLKETAVSDEGIRLDLGLEVTGIRTRDTLPLDEIIREAGQKRVIYVGEGHTNYEHHKIQLEFIRRLNEQGAEVAIGMEMFQTPFQNSLDGYVAGDMDEREFLASSEYFTRWSYNYLLYREILDYARSAGIPVVALNQKIEIIRKVSGGGLDALSEEERRQLPEAMDLSDPGYRDRLRGVFSHHAPGKAFGNFHLAQIIWDETMAQSIATYLNQHPGRRMVVITGQGHTSWRTGIPERVNRLTGLDYSLVVQNDNGPLNPEKADYILFSEPMQEPAFPVIGVALTKVPEGLRIDKVGNGSPASRGGLREGDIITMVGERKIVDVSDLKVMLYDKQHGESLAVKILRKRFLIGPKEMALSLEIQ